MRMTNQGLVQLKNHAIRGSSPLTLKEGQDLEAGQAQRSRTEPTKNTQQKKKKVNEMVLNDILLYL